MSTLSVSSSSPAGATKIGQLLHQAETLFKKKKYAHARPLYHQVKNELANQPRMGLATFIFCRCTLQIVYSHPPGTTSSIEQTLIATRELDELYQTRDKWQTWPLQDQIDAYRGLICNYTRFDKILDDKRAHIVFCSRVNQCRTELQPLRAKVQAALKLNFDF
ncbi:MAG TPA: hypothetical protein VIJ14_05015 [Rhabdochlamydiaceae bacterium]